jgi:hypothetical protein
MMRQLGAGTAIGLLLLSVPSRAQNSGRATELLEGHRKIFSTDGHPKAKGVNLRIAYPESWEAKEGERPNIVQKFVSDGGSGREFALIITMELPLPPGIMLSDQDLQDLISPAELSGMLPEGATFIDAQSTEIDGAPAGLLEYALLAESAGVEVSIHAWTVNLLSDGTLVQVQFQVGGPAGSEIELARRMEEVRPLFTAMANTIVLPERWSSARSPLPHAGTSPASRSSLSQDTSVLDWIGLVMGLLTTWGVGLAPPLATRYLIARRPLDGRTASWIAGGFSIFFWVSFRIVHDLLGERPGTGMVWIVIFFVARWIMTRGYVNGAAHRETATGAPTG